MPYSPITVSRDIEALRVPSGDKLLIKKGTSVVVTQALGGTYTVTTDMGDMARVDAKDADAIGEKVVAAPAAPAAPIPPGPELEKAIMDQLRTVYDPEIPVNIVELGLVFSCNISPYPAGGSHVEIRMGLTAPGCGMGDVLRMDIRNKLTKIPGVASADVQVVFDPVWNPSMMSEAARIGLGM